jgi:hypothetical protein
MLPNTKSVSSRAFFDSIGQSRPKWGVRPTSAFPSVATIEGTSLEVRFVPIVLQKSKVAAVKTFAENLKRKEVADSHSLSRAIEIAHQFGARR